MVDGQNNRRNEDTLTRKKRRKLPVMNLCGLENRRHTKNDRLRVPTLEAKPQLANKYKFNAHEKISIHTHNTVEKRSEKEKKKLVDMCVFTPWDSTEL
jgi:hypothetical protein